MNIRKLRNSEKLKFPFWVEGTFGDDIWSGGGGAGGPVGGGVSGSRRGNGREPDGAGSVGARRARWPTREEMAGYWRAKWQFLWVVGQEGRWQGARGGRGSGRKVSQMAGEGENGRVQEG